MHAAKIGLRLALLGMLLGGMIVHNAQPSAAKGKRKYAKDFEAFVKEVDKSYPFFDLKKIRKGWKKARIGFAKRAKACKSDDDFILLVFDAVKILRDAHITVETKSGQYPKWPKKYFPGLDFLPASKERVIVMHAPPGKSSKLPPGTIITKIDGKPARQVLEDRARAAWKEGGYFSSPQRARLFVYRQPLAGEKKGKSHKLSYLQGKSKSEKAITLKSKYPVENWSRAYNQPEKLKQDGKSFSYVQLESGVGYMWWRRIDESISDGIPRALEACPGAKGWIVDLRANTGGGYGKELLDGMKSLPQPVAVILDAGCISAGETAARDLVGLTKARLFGATTAGSSSSKRRWTFPSGIATIRFSTRSRKGVGGKVIEFNGIEPDVPVEADPEEVRAGKNTEILRAEAYLLDGGR